MIDCLEGVAGVAAQAETGVRLVRVVTKHLQYCMRGAAMPKDSRRARVRRIGIFLLWGNRSRRLNLCDEDLPGGKVDIHG